MSIQSVNWYDYPQYFEMAMADETKPEADFIEAACRRYMNFPARRMLEPGCGGGRLIVEMASRGYDTIGFDNSPQSIAYAQRRLERGQLTAQILDADLAQFRLPKKVDAAFCTFDTFRHLVTERTAASHLRSVAGCLKKGGIYLLGIHLLPLDVSEECTERWSARRGQTKVNYTLRVTATDRRKRLETIRISLRVHAATRDLRMQTEFQFRMYTASQFRRLMRKIPEFELCDVFDFWYEIDSPLKLNDEITDAVFVLRKK